MLAGWSYLMPWRDSETWFTSAELSREVKVAMSPSLTQNSAQFPMYQFHLQALMKFSLSWALLPEASREAAI